METELVVANPMVAETRNSAAVKRGPLVYCFEGVDNTGFSVREASLKMNEKSHLGDSKDVYDDVLGEFVSISLVGKVPASPWNYLYKNIIEAEREYREVMLRGIPYYAWDNRGINEMTIWMQLK